MESILTIGSHSREYAFMNEGEKIAQGKWFVNQAGSPKLERHGHRYQEEG